MSNLGYLIDVDGFEIEKVFLVKELAIGNFSSSYIQLFSYKVGDYRDLTSKQKHQAAWVTKCIHGLRFESVPTDFPQNQIQSDLRKICIDAEQTGKLIGYKGGHYELDLLKSIGYGHLGYNIELLSCPKLEILFERYPEAIQKQCSNHNPIVNKLKNLTIAHCPQMEVYCFMKFVLDLN